MIPVRLTYLTGLRRNIFRNARLVGSWDLNGHYSNQWAESAMQEIVAEDGCPAFTATVKFDDAEVGREFRWGILFDGPVGGANLWGINIENPDTEAQHLYREFKLNPAGSKQEERFYFTYS